MIAWHFLNKLIHAISRITLDLGLAKDDSSSGSSRAIKQTSQVSFVDFAFGLFGYLLCHQIEVSFHTVAAMSAWSKALLVVSCTVGLDIE